MRGFKCPECLVHFLQHQSGLPNSGGAWMYFEIANLDDHVNSLID